MSAPHFSRISDDFIFPLLHLLLTLQYFSISVLTTTLKLPLSSDFCFAKSSKYLLFILQVFLAIFITVDHSILIFSCVPFFSFFKYLSLLTCCNSVLIAIPLLAPASLNVKHPQSLVPVSTIFQFLCYFF